MEHSQQKQYPWDWHLSRVLPPVPAWMSFSKVHPSSQS